ncbi:cell division protein ZipA [Pasteurellaceae bacterium RH1A]|nr:cell division protein ZipA [Pasteurellaceae bacterium RH1A]
MELHILFFILAGLLIAVLVGYSIWSARREKSRVFSNSFATRGLQTEQGNPGSVPEFAQGPDYAPSQPAQTDLTEAQIAQEIEQAAKGITIRLPGQENAPVPEPQVVEQVYSSLAKPEAVVAPEVHLEPEVPMQAVENEPNLANQTLMLYMVAPENQAFSGEVVVAQLEAMGFQYDTEYQIFHRHIDTAASPVIFSVANMLQPGIFDLNTLHRFSTVGLVFFMNVPSSGNDQANLRLMINTVENLAQNLGGFVLDENRQLFDDNARLAYMQRV